MEIKNVSKNLNAASPEPDPCEQLGSFPQGDAQQTGSTGGSQTWDLFNLI